MGQAGTTAGRRRRRTYRQGEGGLRRGIAAILLLAGSGCSTVETRRADPATLDTSTSRSLAEIQTCLSSGFDAMHVLPTYRPLASGGSYALSAQDYVQWVIDIDDMGDRRRIVVHAVTSIWGPDRRLIAVVQGCL